MAQRNLRDVRTVAGWGESRAPLDLTQIYREHAAEVSRWAQRLGGPSVDVDDVLSEVFLVAHRRLPEFRGEAKITTWLYAITLNVVKDMRRRERWRRWLRFGRAQAEPAAGLTPLQELEGRHAAALTYQLLDRLPEAERSALILFELEGLSGEQIAALTGEAVGTIWVRLHRARARFRKHFLAHERRAGQGGLP
jgi:RNA polymerase sigma-70 factor (ECF subfamily)